ncbi:hypothetical protein RCL_jg27834.t2 [Rhizophagus clarus]|uniref:Uncharacterized protein n=1 Tax=Rhizophagus clarus TaxID=94130 RepID=A0A8H3QKE9_9GLOM|nr:hypothetical protein RCL_jg27834.t2 [Rhizophagus clarus]
MVRKELFCPSFANLSTISFSDILENVLCMFHVSDYCSFCGPLRSSYDLNAGTMLRAKIKDMSISDVGRFVLSILRFDLRLFVENPYLEGFARLSTLDGVPKMGEFIEPLWSDQRRKVGIKECRDMSGHSRCWATNKSIQENIRQARIFSCAYFNVGSMCKRYWVVEDTT